MAKVKLNSNPGSRIEVGDTILEKGKTVKLGGLGPRFKAFGRAHTSFVRLEAAVRKAEAKLQQQQRRSGEADALQDLEVERVAGALAGDGYARKNPFEALGFPPPSAIKGLDRAEEAEVVLKLAAAVKKRSDVSPATLAAAARAEKAARAVQAALAPIAALDKAMRQALQARGVAQGEWEYRYAGLKLAARVAAVDGDGRVEAAFFGTPASPAKRTRKKATKAEPQPE